MTQAVLIDLDGTLTDPYPGISASILFALDRLGRPPIDEIALRATVGPLEAAFAGMLDGDTVMAKEALRLYRERYAPIGIYENRVFDGIPEALDDLRSAGLRLFVASSKPRVFCERIIEHFGLLPYFERVHGSEFDGTRVAKSEVIGHILLSEGLAPGDCVMVGDRMHDVEGARAHRMRVVGVSWGYGSAEEFELNPPDAVVSEVATLARVVLEQLELGE